MFKLRLVGQVPRGYATQVRKIEKLADKLGFTEEDSSFKIENKGTTITLQKGKWELTQTNNDKIREFLNVT